MSEIIDFKTRKIIKIEKPLPKEEKKQKAISLMEEVIKELKADKLDPEQCIILLRWENGKNNQSYQYWNNDLTTDSIISLVELLKRKIIDDIGG